MENNVVNFNRAKKDFNLKKNEEMFKNYLSTLKNEELQYEANYLINQSSGDFSQEFLRRSVLLMDELAKRTATTNFSESINRFAENLRKQMSK